MKQKIFTFLFIAVTAGLAACNKNNDNQPDIRAYDEQQIQTYLSANDLTGFSTDTTKDGTGTTGIHYKIISQGTGDTLKYSDRISLVYTVKTMDGKYASVDTITNHFVDFLGHLTNDNLPRGVELAIHNLLKYKGSNMRIMIPSRLAYGVNGYGSGSITNVNSRIAGNQSLDYYVHVIGDQDAYDDQVIKNYMTANSLSGYLKDFAFIDSLGNQVKKYYYYKTVTPGTGVIGDIKEFSKITTTYTGNLLNGVSFDASSQTTATTLSPYSLIIGVQHALESHAAKGTSISLLIPSAIGYGDAVQGTIPSNSVLRFEFQITDVTQP
jgi:FKBP-type peptidyl-prolyl cis-trans isomerase FkpA